MSENGEEMPDAISLETVRETLEITLKEELRVADDDKVRILMRRRVLPKMKGLSPLPLPPPLLPPS